MPLYIIERNFAEQFNEDELDEAGIKLVNDDVGIRWVYSFLSADVTVEVDQYVPSTA